MGIRKFILVQYIFDGIYQVVTRRNIKALPNKSIIKAKYYDGRFYEANIIAKCKNRKVLTEIADNIRNNVPIIYLKKIDMAKLNQEQNKKKVNLNNNKVKTHKRANLEEEVDVLKEIDLQKSVEPVYLQENQANLEEDVDVLKESYLQKSQQHVHLQRKPANLEEVVLKEIDLPKSEEHVHLKGKQINLEEEFDVLKEIDLQKAGEVHYHEEEQIDLDENEEIDLYVKCKDIAYSEPDPLNEALKHNIIILDNTLIVPQDSNKLNIEVNEMDFKGINKKSSQKRHCCYYCYKLVYKIYRHYTSVHKHEKEVRELLALPVKSTHRKLLLDKLRKNGDFIFNTQKKSENDKMIVCRKTSQYKTEREKDVPCPNCKGYYSKLSIRHHVQRCLPGIRKRKGRLNIQAECRKLGNNIHRNCSDDLKNEVFPFLNEDEVTNAIRYDEAVVTYGNYLCRKYTTHHHYAQIRSNLRALGRLILAIKRINPSIQNLYDVLDICHIELIIKGIDEVAGLDKITNLYRAPATAMLLATELKRVCKLLQMEFLKTGNMEGQKRMENVLTIFNLEFHVTVNKKGLNTQKINNRKKNITLPKTDQIARFRIYLENNIRYYISKLNKKYKKEDWVHLTEYTLAHLAVFNRKRPGETQRILIDDFKNHEIMTNEEIIDHLDKEQVRKWARIKFTGKLGKNTALLVHRDFGFTAINLILKYREISGVPLTNKYVFGSPSQFHSQNTFQACKLIRQFSESSGIENPHLLRTRLLRQHFATETATADVDNRLEGRVSDFMSHKRKIHEDYYVMTQKCDDITKVSKLLENFSTTKNDQVITSPSNNDSPRHQESALTDSDSDSSSEPENLTQAEINYVMGTRKSRHSWQAEEKKSATEHFYEEIFYGTTIERTKVNQFYESNKDLYKYRTPHLIMQWIKNERKRVVEKEKGKIGKRLRWSTPEKEILQSTTERHSAEGTNPTVPECELLRQQNLEILENRSAESIKSYIYAEVKRLSNVE